MHGDGGLTLREIIITNSKRPRISSACDFAMILAMVSALISPLAAQEHSTTEARRLFLTGRYSESAKLYGELVEKDESAAAIGLARCHAAQGKLDEAVEVLTIAAQRSDGGDKANCLGELALINLERGDVETAKRQSEEAIELDEKQLASRWAQAELALAAGDLKTADASYKWFVDYYNDVDRIDDPDDLRLVGRAAAQFARWNRLSDQFTFLVNDLYPEALRLNENYWPAHYEAGQLFLEKYNQAEAAKSLAAARRINPNSADVLAALAELAIQNYDLDAAERVVRQALAINPQHAGAMRMRADIHLANFEPDAAVDILAEARKLNRASEETLGRLAASFGMVDGLKDDETDTRMGQLIDEVESRNPHCGTFYFALAEALDKGRKYPHAARYFKQSVDAMPQLVGPRGQLGLMYMRLGEEDQARKVLDESFDIDPFNVRVSNSLKVLEVLNDYESIETEHFVIRFDPKHDAILARYAAKYLEDIYPELCRRLDYQPAEKSLFEIFNRAKNTDGHGWFSARMVGLPQIHTIGACAGKMVALTSPSAMPEPFNWARVLRHEFVHVINMQQTNFNIPHWFTEALAVLLEDDPRPAKWEAMLRRRVPEGKVFDLDSINRGFIRPTSSDDWLMAYCQAEIYAEYMVERFGEDSLGKMLAAYRDNLNTEQALERAFGVEKAEFERGYTEHLNKLVASITVGGEPSPSMTLAELVRAREADPDNADLSARLAHELLRRGKNAQAGPLADHALKQVEHHALATYVKAKLLLSIGETDLAIEKLEAALDADDPQFDALRLLAGLKYKAEDYEQAERLFRLGAKHSPGDLAWTRSLAMVYLKSDQPGPLADALARLAKADPDELTVRKKLAQLALLAKDYPAAIEWANQCLQIDVEDAAVHRLLADALTAAGRDEEAELERNVAAEISKNK